MKITYNKITKTFSNIEMTKKEFIDKYCKVVPSNNEFMPNKPWVKIIMDDCYLTSGISVEKILEDKDQIDFLIMHGITQVESTFHKDEYHEHPVANIGYNPEEQRWYGWSHRAWHDFGIGDTPKEFYPDRTVEGKPIETLEEAKEAASKFAESVD